MSEHKHEDLNDKYIRKDVYEVEKTSVRSLCEQKHEAVDAQLHSFKADIKNIKKQTTATLVTAIIILVGIIVAIGTRALT